MAAPSSGPADASGVRVDALSFCRLECDHSELFLSEYKRSNRTKGLKILRCFPHCCPNHIERSYCGSSLHVIVQTDSSSAPPPSLPGGAAGGGGGGGGGVSSGASGGGAPSTIRAKLADSVFLFARFECSTDEGLRVGDTLPSTTVVRDTQSEENPEGRWIPGIKERASALSSAMKRVATAISEHTLVYQLNGKVYSRWYYDWESGANKAQRLMRHVLKAYVFERCASEDRSSPYALRVIGIVSSPEFTVISYRRAPSEGLPAAGAATGKADASPREPSPSMGIGRGAGAAGASAGSSGRSTPELERPTYDGNKRAHAVAEEAADSDSKRRRRVGGAPAAVAPLASLITLRTASPHELFEDRVLWEHANVHLVTVSKNLALVYYFLKWTPLDYYATFVDELVHQLNHKVLEPLVAGPDGQRLEKLNSFARVLLEHAQTQPTSRHRGIAPPVLSRELEVVLRCMAQAAMWFFSEETRAWTREFVQRHASALTDKTQLRHAFLQWIVEAEAQLNRFVFAQSPLQTLANAAEEIIAAVYTHELFHPKRPMVRQILGEHGFLGWRAFVAQMRDSFIAFSSASKRSSQRGPRGTTPFSSSFSSVPSSSSALPRPPLLPVPLNPVERAWNGDWVLDVEETSWKPQDAAHPDGVSLVAVLDLMTQLSRVHVALQLDKRLLCVASRAAFATAGLEAMQLVLDGKSRVFRFSPHGWSTAMGEGADGDYIGSTRFETPDRLIAYLETFRWSRLPGARSYHVRMRIECWKQQRLFVNGEVLETISNASFPHEDLQFMPERTIGAKMKLVNRVFVRQPGPAAAALPLLTNAGVPSGQHPGGPQASPTAWRRLSGFRLVYSRTRR